MNARANAPSAIDANSRPVRRFRWAVSRSTVVLLSDGLVRGHRDEQQGEVGEGAEVEGQRRPAGGTQREPGAEADEPGAERQGGAEVEGAEESREVGQRGEGHQSDGVDEDEP